MDLSSLGVVGPVGADPVEFEFEIAGIFVTQQHPKTADLGRLKNLIPKGAAPEAPDKVLERHSDFDPFPLWGGKLSLEGHLHTPPSGIGIEAQLVSPPVALDSQPQPLEGPQVPAEVTRPNRRETTIVFQ